jgi:hypothetical protein
LHLIVAKAGRNSLGSDVRIGPGETCHPAMCGETPLNLSRSAII